MAARARRGVSTRGVKLQHTKRRPSAARVRSIINCTLARVSVRGRRDDDARRRQQRSRPVAGTLGGFSLSETTFAGGTRAHRTERRSQGAQQNTRRTTRKFCVANDKDDDDDVGTTKQSGTRRLVSRKVRVFVCHSERAGRISGDTGERLFGSRSNAETRASHHRSVVAHQTNERNEVKESTRRSRRTRSPRASSRVVRVVGKWSCSNLRVT